MALSTANKAAVRRYLGYPDINRVVYTEIESAMVALSAEGEDVVEGLLTQIAAVQTRLAGEWSYVRVVRAEEVTLDGQGALRALRSEGRRLVGELAAVFDLSPKRDIFGGGGGSGVARRGA